MRVALDNDVARLARTHPFSLMPREAVQLIAFSSEKRRLGAGETLFHAGDPGDAGFFVHSGAIALIARDASLDTARRAGVGALIGESALYAPVVRQVEALVLEDALVTRVPRDIFRRVLTEFPEAAVKVRGALAERTRQLVNGLDAARARSFSPAPRVRPAQ
jgi:CRP-like cAMP-binding protein